MTTPDPFRALETPAYHERMGARPWRDAWRAALPLLAQGLYLAAALWALWALRG